IEAALERGADPGDVKIAEVEKVPLQYVTNKATRIKVKAVGKLRIPDQKAQVDSDLDLSLPEDGEYECDERKSTGSADTPGSSVKHATYIDIPSYKPDVRNGVWYLSPVDLEFIASGTGVLGTGGGGPSYLQY